MNNLQPYEKHMANELRNVPVPDKEKGWEEMRKLLDRDRPVGGSPWSGNRKWYWMGLTVLLIIGGLWGSQRISESSTSKDLTAEVQGKTTATTESLTAETQGKTTATTESLTAETQGKTTATTKSLTAETQSETSSNPKTSSATKITDIESNVISDKHSTSNSENLIKVVSRKKNQTEFVVTKKNQKSEFEKDISAFSAVKQIEFEEQSLRYSNINFQNSAINKEIEIPIPSNTVPDPIIAGKTDKAFQKEARIKGMEEDNRKMSKRSMKGNFGEKEQELTFAAGLALPKTFAVGGQQASGYGISGKTSTITDYLPVPYFQYHLNDKMFLQTELHFQSPQFTDRLLIYQKQNEVSPSTRTEKNIFVEKLYYFNIPFNFYYSPIRNFYIGSGIQYSSLLSGLASFEEKKYAGNTLETSSTKVLRFKDDSVAKKLSPSELRYQFDANYYVKRFTLGLRYNQALKNFVNIQPGTILPYTEGRNKAFLLYLRYNIWEERKKNKY